MAACQQPPAQEPEGQKPSAPISAVMQKVRSQPVTRRALHAEMAVVGSVTYDQDYYAVVGVQTAGRVVRLAARLGDRVAAGALLAEIESPEVGRAAGEYVASRARAAAATADLRREEALSAKNISSVREFEVARARAAVEAANVRAASQQLRALGVTPSEIDATDGPKVALRAPFAGTVVARNVALGESVHAGTDLFVVADVTHLWVLLDVYERDLERIHTGQRAILQAESLPDHLFDATVSYIDMRVDTQNRTASVRVAFDNHAERLRPGQFVSARILDAQAQAAEEVLVVPRRAVQVVDAKTLVFVREGQSFVPRQILMGRTDRDDVEVRQGLTAGEEVVVEGAFLLKSTHFR